MKIILSILATIIITTASWSQDLQRWYDKKEYVAIRYYKGNEIKVPITVDTVYLINPASYKLYKDVFRDHRALNSDARKLNLLFESMRTTYEKRIEEQNTEYTELKRVNDSLMYNASKFADITQGQLMRVDESLTKIDVNVTQAQTNIREAENSIKKEIRSSFGTKLKWGAGGFVIGLAATALVFAVTQ
jgi:hypothetical protein